MNSGKDLYQTQKRKTRQFQRNVITKYFVAPLTLATEFAMLRIRLRSAVLPVNKIICQEVQNVLPRHLKLSKEFDAGVQEISGL